MKIYLLLNQPYPYGYALTKRFHLYAKGFVNNGHYSKILIPRPTEYSQKSINKSTSGFFEGVPFEYTWKNTIRSRNFLIRRIHDFTGTLKAGIIILKEKPDIVITSYFPFRVFLYLKIISIITSFKIFSEKNEVDNLDEDNISQKTLIKARCTNSLFSGFIAINKQLSNYMSSDLGLKRKSIIVPILIEDFKKDKKLPVKKTIVYTGTYLERKDGILKIMNAFAEIKDKYPAYTLVLTGCPERSRIYNKMLDLISTKGLEKQVCFTGYLSEKALRDTLISANILIISKPANRQNFYNFPTKIGEYFISGRPVIATKVGVIGEIFEHKKNIIFSEYSVTSISKKMRFIIENPELANEIGHNARIYALENFNYLKHTKRMVDFFKELN